MSVRRFEGEDHAENYRKYRPVFNDDLFIRIMEYVRQTPSEDTGEKLSLAVDVACGSGQSIKGLVKYFEHIVGVDVSPAQIDQAIANNVYENIEFKVSQAESLPMEDGSVDLITVGMALHWFDWPEFYKEVDRVLRPGGVVAAYMHSYWITVVEHPKAMELTSFMTNLIGTEPVRSYWHERDCCLDRKYTDDELQIPYSDSTRDDSMALYMRGTIETLFGYLSTRSMFNCYFAANGEEGQKLWTNAINGFCEIYGSKDMNCPLTLKLDIHLLLGRKPEEI